MAESGPRLDKAHCSLPLPTAAERRRALALSFLSDVAQNRLLSIPAPGAPEVYSLPGSPTTLSLAGKDADWAIPPPIAIPVQASVSLPARRSSGAISEDIPEEVDASIEHGTEPSPLLSPSTAGASGPGVRLRIRTISTESDLSARLSGSRVPLPVERPTDKPPASSSPGQAHVHFDREADGASRPVATFLSNINDDLQHKSAKLRVVTASGGSTVGLNSTLSGKRERHRSGGVDETDHAHGSGASGSGGGSGSGSGMGRAEKGKGLSLFGLSHFRSRGNVKEKVRHGKYPSVSSISSTSPASPWHLDAIRGMNGLTKRRAESYAYLLHPSGSLGPRASAKEATGGGGQGMWYDPEFLDRPEIHMDVRSTVMALPSMMSSIIQYARPDEVKHKMNARFEEQHPDVAVRGITLSQIRDEKVHMVEVGKALDVEISTVAFAMVYYEKLLISGFIDKANRRVTGGVCFVLAFKVNESNEKDLAEMMQIVSKYVEVPEKEIREQEFPTYVALGFDLYPPSREFLPHVDRIYADFDTESEEVVGRQKSNFWTRFLPH